jgi:16S rRNA (adenine1518-N6/adenine1519-N6)-dimethyltransferase
VDLGVARAVAEALPCEPPRVLEIGPGRGALTRELVRRYPRVLAIEVDARLAAALPARLGASGQLEVVTADALLVDLVALCGEVPWLAAGNLPYSVATPLLRRFLEAGERFSAAVFMVQQEVAERLVAPPGASDRGLLTLEVEARARAELLFRVPPRCFQPRPKVVSAVVRLTPVQGGTTPPETGHALDVAAKAFQHRRKTIVNALAATYPRELVAAALAGAGLAATARAQELSLAQWQLLAAALPTAERGR